MLVDCVVDANIWGHAQNPSVPEFDSAVRFVGHLREAAVVLCVDEGFSLVEQENRSIIGHEYLQQLSSGSPAFAVLAHLAATGRVRFVSAKVSRGDRDRIRNLVRRNTRDQHYVRVTCNTTDRVLVSHDNDDLAPDVRDALQSRLNVEVLDAHNCCDRIEAA